MSALLQNILVPLDGSALAEAVLPAVAYLAAAGRGRVTLLHVVEKDAPQTVHGQTHLTDRAQAERYLGEVSERLARSGLAVETRVEQAASRRVAREIAAQDRGSGGLLALCTHGHGGLSAIWRGSIAQQACNDSQRPVLLVHPGPSDFSPTGLLVPIDGNPDHEHAVPVAVELAAALRLPLTMLLVIPTSTTLPSRQSPIQRLMPLLTSRMLDLEEDEAAAYLEEKRKHVCASLEALLPNGCLECDFLVRRGDAAQVIMETARAQPGLLPVVGTHGRSGFQGFWEGSVAAKIGSALRLPLVLAPVRPD